MIGSIEEFYKSALKAIEEFDKFSRDKGIVGIAVADHICYKCDSIENFERMRAMFENCRLTQDLIAGRRITYIILKNPVESSLGEIRFLELSDQKPDGSQEEGFDHVEVYPKSGDYESFVSAMRELGVNLNKVERPHHTTYDADIGNGFLIRLTEEPLIEKIKKEMT